MPAHTPLNARVVHSCDMGDYSLENVIFYSRPNLPVPANLYRPKAPVEGKRPAVLCSLGHSLDAGKGNKSRKFTLLALLGGRARR